MSELTHWTAVAAEFVNNEAAPLPPIEDIIADAQVAYRRTNWSLSPPAKALQAFKTACDIEYLASVFGGPALERLASLSTSHFIGREMGRELENALAEELAARDAQSSDLAGFVAAMATGFTEADTISLRLTPVDARVLAAFLEPAADGGRHINLPNLTVEDNLILKMTLIGEEGVHAKLEAADVASACVAQEIEIAGMTRRFESGEALFPLDYKTIQSLVTGQLPVNIRLVDPLT